MLFILCVAALAVFDTTNAGCSKRRNTSKDGGNGPRGCIDPHEHYEECGASCTVTCENVNGKPYACTQDCLAGCRCDDGYVRDGNRGCIRKESCNTAKSQTKPVCGQNEIYKNCTSYCPVTCAHLTGGAPQSCASGCKGEGCECVDGTARNDQGDCVDYDQCPNYKPCPRPNEHYEQCGSACTVTCRNMNGPPVACTAQCVSGCRCNDGYVRNDNGICIKPDDCPNARKQKARTGGPGGPYCRGENEHPEECGASCTVTCDNMNGRAYACTDKCIPGCRCDDGYVRDGDKGCVKKESCYAVRKQNRTPACGRNAHFEYCGTACPDTCDNYNSSTRVCTRQCQQGCQCNSGFVFNSDKQCVKPSDCP